MTADVRLSFFGKDPRSTVVLRDGRIVRTGVDRALTDAVLADAGVRRLMAEGMLIPTSVLADEAGGSAVEHRRIAPFTYPGEWSFSMLRDAALATLDVRETLARAGLDLKDAHAYNVAFDGCAPVFIDFASIDRADPRYVEWRAGEEYLDAFVRILRIWSRTNRRTALSFLNAVWARPDDEALVFSGPALHRLRSRLRRAYGKALVATAMAPQARDETLARLQFAGAKKLAASAALSGMGLAYGLTGHPYSVPKLRRATLAIARPVDATMWASYQQDLSLHQALTPRFRRIIDVIAGLGARDAFEVAGNQGALSEALLDGGAVSSVICSDYDEHAVDALYLRMRGKGRKGITPLVHDVMMPDPIRGPGPRNLQGDVVIALALTHHLLLTQGYRLDAVLERIAAHGRRHLVIEFMPKGLWDGASGPPVPSWYTQEWFASGLERLGRIALCEKLEENRVAFLVELGAGRSQGEVR